MPVHTWDTLEDFNLAYNIGAEPNGHPNTRAEVRRHYQRSVLFSTDDTRLDYGTHAWQRVIAHFGWPRTTNIIIFGAGFAWGLEYLRAQGFANSWAVDTSTYIQENKTTTDPDDGIQRCLVPNDLFNVNAALPGQRTQLINGTVGVGNLFGVIVTERMLSSFSDQEVVEAAALLRDHLLDPTGRLIHIETPTQPDGQQAGYNWHTLAEWKVLLPDDDIVSSGGREFL